MQNVVSLAGSGVFIQVRQVKHYDYNEVTLDIYHFLKIEKNNRKKIDKLIYFTKEESGGSYNEIIWRVEELIDLIDGYNKIVK